MAKTKISEFSSTPSNNTDIDSINIAEGCAPSGINDAIRELMAQLKDWQSGTSNDPYVVGSSGSLTLNQGTANGVPYLNGSKVVTSGSSLVFDGTNMGIGNSNPVERLEVVNASGAVTAKIWSATNTTPIASLELQRGTNATWGADAYGDYRIRNDAGALLFQYGESSVTTERLRLDSSGNLGLGVTPSASWAAGTRAIQFGPSSALYNPASNSRAILASNAIFTSGVSAANYITSNAAAFYDQDNGTHKWYTAASGTAGNAITFTQAMTLDASGRLLIGTTSSRTNNLSSASFLQLEAVNSSATGALVRNSADTSGAGLILGKSRGTSVGSVTAVASGDRLGTLSFSGTDGTSMLSAATIISEVDGTPGTNDMPGRLVFSTTADGASSPTERMRLDSSGNMGLGVTPSAWGSGYNAFDVGNGYGLARLSTDGGILLTNAYFNGTNYVYKNSAFAAGYEQNDSIHKWFTAASGTAGATITFTQAMTLDASGNWLLGRTSTSSYRAQITGGTDLVDIVGTDVSFQIHNKTSNVLMMGVGSGDAIAFATGGNTVERMRIDSSGNLQMQAGAVMPYAPAPASISTTATLTNANIQGQIINTTGTSYTVTMPLGTTLETLASWATTSVAYDFYVINTASGTITMAVNTGVTSLGGLTIATGVSAHFRIRRTAANTFVLYRLV